MGCLLLLVALLVGYAVAGPVGLLLVVILVILLAGRT
jgi:hypothetical protein